MSNILYFSNEIKSNLLYEDKDYADEIIPLFNQLNDKILIDSINYSNDYYELGKLSTYLGVLESDGDAIAYVSIIPPKVGTRTGFASQQIFPGLTADIEINLNSNNLSLTTKPVYVLDFNQEGLTSSTALNVEIIKQLGMPYCSLTADNSKQVLISNGVGGEILDLESYANAIDTVATRNGNTFFSVNKEAKSVIFEVSTLGDGTGLTNQPYWYVMKSYLAAIFAINENYSIDLTNFDEKITLGNKTLDVFRKYCEKINSKNVNVVQKIYFGAPGTGKSYQANKLVDELKINKECIFRTTFHPEYSYTDFVGQIYPKIDKITNEVSYDFKPGIFTRAITNSFKDLSKINVLIIEELTRGQCASIFGDIFQLLDRYSTGIKEGYSRYVIDNELIANEILNYPDSKIELPANLFILATVNNSDQNVFTMDTAFKRRFDFEYVSTDPVKNEEGTFYLNDGLFDVVYNEENYEISWIDFYTAINKYITSIEYLNLSEDKQLGQFFLEFKDTADKETNNKIIKEKLLDYLWSDVMKASFKPNLSIFKKEILRFGDLYKAYGEKKQIFSDELLSLIVRV